ncbi:hypothetical protein JCM10908_004791 [Rhodotorula pacifica]|uniref:uncharacterized protein n=1 Tax=Rhodotorula pacifica TaxID=1495444 RepID=UPI00316B3E29
MKTYLSSVVEQDLPLAPPAYLSLPKTHEEDLANRAIVIRSFLAATHRPETPGSRVKMLDRCLMLYTKITINSELRFTDIWHSHLAHRLMCWMAVLDGYQDQTDLACQATDAILRMLETDTDPSRSSARVILKSNLLSMTVSS